MKRRDCARHFPRQRARFPRSRGSRPTSPCRFGSSWARARGACCEALHQHVEGGLAGAVEFPKAPVSGDAAQLRGHDSDHTACGHKALEQFGQAHRSKCVGQHPVDEVLFGDRRRRFLVSLELSAEVLFKFRTSLRSAWTKFLFRSNGGRIRQDILEYRGAIRSLGHHREDETALWAGCGQGRLLHCHIESTIADVSTSRTYPNEASIFVFKVDDDVFHNGAGADGRLLRVFVVGVHVPVFEGLEARPKADLIVPMRIIRMDPPCQMEKSRKLLKVMTNVRENDLKFSVVILARKPQTLHALIDCHKLLAPYKAPPGPTGLA
jgi:hypothetical protein